MEASVGVGKYPRTISLNFRKHTHTSTHAHTRMQRKRDTAHNHELVRAIPHTHGHTNSVKQRILINMNTIYLWIRDFFLKASTLTTDLKIAGYSMTTAVCLQFLKIHWVKVYYPAPLCWRVVYIHGEIQSSQPHHSPQRVQRLSTQARDTIWCVAQMSDLKILFSLCWHYYRM